MNTERYKTYKTDDFIYDEDFRGIVRSSSSDDRLKEFLESMPEKRYEINLAVQIIRGLHKTKFQQSANRKKELWQKIETKQKKHVQLSFVRYAASFLLLLCAGSTLFYFTTRNQSDKSIVAKNTNDAQLILANGKTVSISSKQSTIKYSSDGSGILVNDSSGVGQSVEGMGLNKLIVPFGKRSLITLSDGTKVWLNSGSTLSFPPAFRGKTREVNLTGEAFFDVTHNKEKPFYVKTDAFKMKVYGTRFDVRAYEQDKDYNIVLVEGKVSMNSSNNSRSKEVFLSPNHKATISRGAEDFEISDVDNMETYTSWTEGYLTFSNSDISDLLKQVSRYYNATIEVNMPTNNEKIYGKLDLKDNLERVLDGIAFISKTNYKKIGNKYVFYE